MSEKLHQVAHCLLEIEMELRTLQLWSEIAPEPEALQSQLPFCHDTLNFPQWLQFVFLYRMRMIIESSATLPTACAILPYAEEYFMGSGLNVDRLLERLQEIDKLLTL